MIAPHVAPNVSIQSKIFPRDQCFVQNMKQKILRAERGSETVMLQTAARMPRRQLVQFERAEPYGKS